jgi:hypothetical protein
MKIHCTIINCEYAHINQFFDAPAERLSDTTGPPPQVHPVFLDRKCASFLDRKCASKFTLIRIWKEMSIAKVASAVASS